MVEPGFQPEDKPVWELFQQIRKSYRKVLLHTGTIYQDQNYPFFLDCVRQYNAVHTAKIALVLVGLNKDGMQFNPLLQKDVYLLPKVESATAFHMQAEADVLILPAWYTHRYTGFIAKVFEFLWFGKRVWSSPLPPADFAQFLSGFPHVQVLNDYTAFEMRMRQLQQQEQPELQTPFDKTILTRKYWMQQLAAHIKKMKNAASHQ